MNSVPNGKNSTWYAATASTQATHIFALFNVILFCYFFSWHFCVAVSFLTHFISLRLSFSFSAKFHFRSKSAHIWCVRLVYYVYGFFAPLLLMFWVCVIVYFTDSLSISPNDFLHRPIICVRVQRCFHFLRRFQSFFLAPYYENCTRKLSHVCNVTEYQALV